jgi:hypothetical protein
MAGAELDAAAAKDAVSFNPATRRTRAVPSARWSSTVATEPRIRALDAAEVLRIELARVGA